MGQTGLDAKKGAEILSTVLDGYTSTVQYPKTTLANSLKGIAQVKLGNVGTRIFYTSISGFDTHAGQAPIHARSGRTSPSPLRRSSRTCASTTPTTT